VTGPVPTRMAPSGRGLCLHARKAVRAINLRPGAGPFEPVVLRLFRPRALIAPVIAFVGADC
jgi:hypothetical protein